MHEDFNAIENNIIIQESRRCWKSNKATDDIGYYTAICYKNNNKWIKYDDYKDAEQILVQITLLAYSLYYTQYNLIW